MAMNVGDGKEDDVMMEVNTTPLESTSCWCC